MGLAIALLLHMGHITDFLLHMGPATLSLTHRPLAFIRPSFTHGLLFYFFIRPSLTPRPWTSSYSCCHQAGTAEPAILWIYEYA